VVLIFWMGLWPNQFMNYAKTSVDHLIQSKHNYTLSLAPGGSTSEQ